MAYDFSSEKFGTRGPYENPLPQFVLPIGTKVSLKVAFRNYYHHIKWIYLRKFNGF